MAIQLLPIIKAVTPYVAQVATAAIPAFTKKTKRSKDDELIAEQIKELQIAATQNAESVHLLADQLQQVMVNIEKASAEAEKEIARYKLLILSAFLMSFISIAACAFLIFS